MTRETHNPRTRRGALFLALAVVAFLLALPAIVAPPPLSPILLEAEVLTSDIYSLAGHVRRLPVEIALPHLAQVGLRPFVESLPLDAAPRSRILARIASDDFVDELVPFLLAVKSMYLPDEDAKAEGFDAYLRRSFSPEDDVPGIEHSMFRWQPAAEASTPEPEAPGGMDRTLVAELLTFYDAVFLQGRDDAGALEERLVCEREGDEESLRETEQRARPAVESLLRRLRERMEPGSDMEHAVASTLEDPDRLETVSLSVVRFIEHLVCKHYRFFATRVNREEQLRAFLLAQLEAPQGGRIWRYLDQAVRDRRYGVLTVVDGLQGHLVEALARGEAGDPFLGEVLRAHRRGSNGVAPGIAGTEAPEQQTEFLEAVVENGYRHPHYLSFFGDLYDVPGSSPLPGELSGLGPWAVARSGIATTPTISVRNLPVVLTGAPVTGEGSTGIPNFHFVDRSHRRDGVQQGRAYYFFGNDAFELSALTREAGMATLFERLGDRSSYGCAAQYDEYAQAGIDPFFNLALGEALRDFGEVLCFGELSRRSDNTRLLRELHEELLTLRPSLGADTRWWDWPARWIRRTQTRRAEQLAREIARLETESLPELLIWYNPWPDHFAHFKGPFSDEIIAPSGELARLAYWLERLADVYRDGGVAGRTLFGMAGDHGLAPVYRLVSPEALVLDALRAEGVPMHVIKISSDEGEGPKLTNPLKPPSMRGYDVVVASTAGGNLMLDLFADQGDRWAEQPLEADIRAWQPIAWQEAGDERRVDLIAELVRRLGASLDYLVVRAAPCSPERADVRVIGPHGSAHITRRGDRIHYQADEPGAGATRPSSPALLDIDRATPFAAVTGSEHAERRAGIEHCIREADAEDVDTWCSEREWRRLLRLTARPDSVIQLAHLYDTDRAGTINLFPADGVAYNSIVPGRHAGESFHEKDAFAGLWGAPITRSSEQGRIEVALGGSVPKAIYEYLANRRVEADESGWESPSLWDDLYPTAPPTAPAR